MSACTRKHRSWPHQQNPGKFTGGFELKHIILALIIFSILFSGIGQASTIEVQDLTGSLTAEDLVNLLLGENSTVVVSNITVTGTNLAIGNFTSGGSLGFERGVIMTTGNVSYVPEGADLQNTEHGESGDSDLDALFGGTSSDAIVLEFDFIPEKAAITFNYRFASVEAFGDVMYDDPFGLFVNGENIALLPNDSRVSVSTIETTGDYYEAGPFNTSFTGFSIILTATAEVEPGTLNHMKFAIADMADGIYDSGVFIEGGSFVSNSLPDAPLALLCEGETNPTNVFDLTPEFSWTFFDSDVNDTQSAYQIQVSTNEGGNEMWDTGKVLSSSSTDISYAGSDLEWDTTYYWRVKTWDNSDGEGVYCDNQTFISSALPVADFTSNVTSGAVPLSVNFTDLSENSPTSWSWDFGDGNTSTEQSPTHTYTNVGTYNVSLNATNVGGSNTITESAYITVAIAPVADFSADVTSGAVSLTVNFTDHSTNAPTGWEWNFGDGNTSTDQDPTHTYTAVGTYSVSLNATNVGGSNTITESAYITVAIAPVADFSADVTSGAVPLTVNFTDHSTNAPTGWEWNFGDGNTSTDQNPIHTYVSAECYKCWWQQCERSDFIHYHCCNSCCQFQRQCHIRCNSAVCKLH